MKKKMTNKCKTCGHEKKYHKPSQYYKGKGCHFFINKDELDYERCPCKKFIPEDKDNGITNYDKRQVQYLGKSKFWRSG